jgi:hypothetical protein
VEFEARPNRPYLPELYAKVVDVAGEGDDALYGVRFTSVPPTCESWIKGHVVSPRSTAAV